MGESLGDLLDANARRDFSEDDYLDDNRPEQEAR